VKNVKEKLREILQDRSVPPGSVVMMANIDDLTDFLFDELYMDEMYEGMEFE